MTSGSGWNLWVWLTGGGCGGLWVESMGVVIRRYIDFLIHVYRGAPRNIEI